MRIIIDDTKYLINLIKTNIQDNFINCFNKIEYFIKMYSIEGIFIINQNHLFKLKYNDLPIETMHNYLGSNLSVFIDNTYYYIEETHHLPIDYYQIIVKHTIFKLHEHSNVTFIMEEMFDNSILITTLFYIEYTYIPETYTTPTDITIPTNITNLTTTDEINKLLSNFTNIIL
jgi:hypothetical protein